MSGKHKPPRRPWVFVAGLLGGLVLFEVGTPQMAAYAFLPRIASDLQTSSSAPCVASHAAQGWQDSLATIFSEPQQGVYVAHLRRERLAGVYLPARDLVVLDDALCEDDAQWRRTLSHEYAHVFQARYGRAFRGWWEAQRIPAATRGHAATAPSEQQAEALSQGLAILSAFASLPAQSQGPDPVTQWREALRSVSIQLPITLALLDEEEARELMGRDPTRVYDDIEIVLRMTERRAPGTRAVTRLLLTHPQWAGHPLVQRPAMAALLLGPDDAPQPWVWPAPDRTTHNTFVAARMLEMWLGTPTPATAPLTPTVLAHQP